MVSRDGLIAVYMMASAKHDTLYTGVTSDLARRAFEHPEGALPGFTRTYACHRLVWCELHEDMVAALQRERSLERWSRAWKTNLIERANPHWDDLYGSWMSCGGQPSGSAAGVEFMGPRHKAGGGGKF